MEQEVHGSYAKHCLVGVIPVNHARLDVVSLFTNIHCRLIVLLDVLDCFNKETGRTHGWVADIILWSRFHHLYNHADDVARSTELTICARCCHLAKDILIHIAHGITIVHVERVNAINNFGKGTGIWNKEDSRLHVTAICRFLTSTDMLDKLKDTLTNYLEHVFCTKVLEHMPTQVLVWNTSPFLITHSIRIHPKLSFEKCRVLYLTIPVASILFFLKLLVIEHLHEEDIGHLLQHGDRVGYAGHKECVPYLVNLVFYLSCNHILILYKFIAYEVLILYCSLPAQKNTFLIFPVISLLFASSAIQV